MSQTRAILTFPASGDTLQGDRLKPHRECLYAIREGNHQRISGVVALDKVSLWLMAHLNFADVARRCFDLHSSRVDQTDLEIEPNLSSELPPVLADRVQLQQVLLNFQFGFCPQQAEPKWNNRNQSCLSSSRRD